MSNLNSLELLKYDKYDKITTLGLWTVDRITYLEIISQIFGSWDGQFPLCHIENIICWKCTIDLKYCVFPHKVKWGNCTRRMGSCFAFIPSENNVKFQRREIKDIFKRIINNTWPDNKLAPCALMDNFSLVHYVRPWLGPLIPLKVHWYYLSPLFTCLITWSW